MVVFFVVITGMSAIADAITISQFGFHLWEPFGSGSKTERPKSPGQSASPLPTIRVTATPTPVPPTRVTATPTPVPPLDRQLEEALSVSSTSARNVALFIVAQDAVLTRDYWTAIRAASATPWNSAQAKNLAFVVRCAIEDRLYVLAAEAADKIKTNSARDRLKIEVIEARRWSTSEILPSYVDRESMACFNSLSK